MRYLVVRVRGFNCPWDKVEGPLLASLREKLGSAAFAAGGVAIVAERGSASAPIGIIKGTTGAISSIRAALCLVNYIDGKPAAVDVTGVSGTIRSAVQKFMIEKQEESKCKL